MPVQIGNDTLLTVNGIRQKLNIWYEIDATNTPNVQRIVDDIFKKKRSFADRDALYLEVKQRDFGLRHVAAMKALQQRQARAITTFRGTNNLTDDGRFNKYIKNLKKSASSRNVRPPQPPATFMFWGSLSPFKPETPNVSALTKKQFYRWATQRPGATEPLFMNCWECVLYSGAWTDGNQRQPLYPREYVFWTVLFQGDVPSRTYQSGNEILLPTQAPRFVKHIIDHPVSHRTKIDDHRIGNKPGVPSDLLPGMIVLFGCGKHVALYTGNARRAVGEGAREIYGPWGHEILELDGTTVSIEYSTIEDILASNGTYNTEVHFGWLPEVTTNETLTFGDITLVVAATHFYS